ncbi:MAG: DEAD/DEAH box helicase [Archaeoglobus sp.]|uniref:DEAD/DEAH box helicase n=1 Tax=Archaeoglobus sp. TaxID=1872626 RepID=UPI001E121BAF|nr:DEAD/DEAH box helicase [Archaeoglobus sp.]MBO8180734.1 DEAD/DEAH box helicase [Archaeoglobus sp.]
MEYVTHPLIRENTIERRMYQISIAATALTKNTLVVIPTGLGKTTIAALVIASRLLNEEGKVLFLAPTKPLVEQHARFLKKVLKVEEIVSLSGEVSPEKRRELWGSARIIVSTPQVIENDLLAGRISLEDVILIVFDEAHRAVGNYAYVFIAKEYLRTARKPLILAMTASPGSDPERIMEVIQNLGIEAIEVRTEWDDDVALYVGKKRIEWLKVDIPEEMKEVKEKLEECVKIRFKRLRDLGIEVPENSSKRDLLALQEALQVEAAESGSSEIFEALSILAEILKLQHAIELIETQGVKAVKSYLRKLIREATSRGGSKAAKSIVNDPIFKKAVLALSKCKAEHPKLEKLKEVLKKQFEKNPDSRVIVFTNYRDSAEMLVNELSPLFPVAKFVGQASRDNDKGMRQREQIETLDKFRKGEYKVLVATSVGEEGLDIPSTDLVVFYEAVPSEIRAIQRKGRTGRGREGRIVVLVTKGTRDEAYYYSSMKKERKMYDKILEIKRMLDRKQRSLGEYTLAEETGVKVIVDSRELRSEVVKHLRDLGARIELRNLEVADYIVSDRVAVERKTVEDFLNSIIQKDRLFSQVAKMKSAYSRPVIVIEGENLYRGGMHPNAVRGAIASLVIDFGIPVLRTSSPKETAELIFAMARREQEEKRRGVVEHAAKTKRTLKEEQEYIVSSISNVGSVIAKNLLDYFQTIENIATADEEELAKVPKVGKKIAKRIRRVMTTPYSEAGFYDSESF